MSDATRHVVVMGVSGCGKSTVAAELARSLGWDMREADNFHPPSNIEKMSSGIPLTDEDRRPWLEGLAAWMTDRAQAGRSTVMACSALRRMYRDILRDGPPNVAVIHLDGPIEVVAQRVSGRQDHFMPPELLRSQYDTLEPLEPDELGIRLDLSEAQELLVAAAREWISQAL